jgi:hypothetical protein
MALAMLGVFSMGLSAQVFTVSLPAERSSKQLDGRVLLIRTDRSHPDRSRTCIMRLWAPFLWGKTAL